MILRQWGGRSVAGAVALGAVAALLPFGPAEAQRRSVPPAQEVYTIDAGGAGSDFDTRTVRNRFQLFGNADAAHAGMRATGNYGTAITNYGDCHSPLFNCQNNRVRTQAGGTNAPYFEVQWVYGAAPSQFVKIRNVAPSVANAGGGGWTAGYNQTVLGRPLRFGPHDGTLGRMFSGTTATTDGSCRDHTGFGNGSNLGGVTKSGLQILPASDCPETWGSEGWNGSHPIDLLGYKALFDQQGADFGFDFWRVPEQYQRTDKMFMGTRFHTYGETTDYNADVLTNYGSVVPGGSGAPVHQGYPLGLLIRFEAFNFAVPTVASSYFVRATIINNSQELWNAPIDYDSLYFGFSIGTLFGTQNVSRYADPSRGMVVYHGSGAKGAAGPCGDAARQPYPAGCSGGAGSGYNTGASGIIILKSPIGDLRNKLFSKTSAGTNCQVGVDPFCDPTHPLAGDTITFTRQSFGDFGGAEALTFGTGARAAFGFLAADEQNTLAGRDAGTLNDRTLYTAFRSELWTTNKVHYNKFVPPGNWDYNKDLILDTLALDTCGQFGCVAMSQDTMPGGWLNRRGNIGGVQSLGPFSLAAGDTTSFVYAHLAEPDSVQFWSTVNAVIDLYQNFYLAPEAPPPVRVASTTVVAGSNQFGTANPNVAIAFTDDPARWVDPFLTKVADDIEGAALGTPLQVLRDANPGLVATVRARASDNLERIEIYKSCDGGASFTADNDCAGDPATRVEGGADVFGWQTYSIQDVSPTGTIPTSFTDANVDGGRTYTYVFVAKSRGAKFLLNTAAGPDSVVFAPEIRNPLSRSTSDPNVVAVYVPASKPAGYQAAQVNVTSAASATSPFVVNLTDNVATASYRAIFGNEILVGRDSNTATGEVAQSVVTIRRSETVDANNVATDSIIRSETFTFASPDVFLVQGAGVAQASDDLGGGVTRLNTLYTGLGFALVTGAGGPVFASQTLTGAATTPGALLGRAAYPGFSINATNSLGTYNAAGERQLRGPISIAENNLLPSDTVVPAGVVNPFMVQWREGSSTATADGRGRYEISWVDDPFGVDRGFRLDLGSPTSTQAEVQATLAAREVGTTGLTDAETATLMNADQTELVAVKVPFTIRNVLTDRPVSVAMVRRLTNRIVLGDGLDTLSVAVQEDMWVPGSTLALIEDITEDSVSAVGLVLGANGQPMQRTRRALSFGTAVLGCNQVRESCNPVLQTTAGATGYNPMRDGDRTQFEYFTPFSPATEIAFDVIAPVTGDQITAITDSALSLVRVVPNPYLIFSQYQNSIGAGQLLFTNLPSRGTIRIYTVAGQFVQQILWEPTDLQGEGDLFWNMRTREGIDIASGLYLWALTAPSDPSNPSSAPITARGKFVVIRGNAN
jgi:hypothetical protein